MTNIQQLSFLPSWNSLGETLLHNWTLSLKMRLQVQSLPNFKMPVLGKTSTEKRMFTFGHCLNYLTPHPPKRILRQNSINHKKTTHIVNFSSLDMMKKEEHEKYSVVSSSNRNTVRDSKFDARVFLENFAQEYCLENQICHQSISSEFVIPAR